MNDTTSTNPRHGIFYYVFWGVVSLVATVAILFVAAAVISGMMVGALTKEKQNVVARGDPTRAVATIPDVAVTESSGIIEKSGGLTVTGVIWNVTHRTLNGVRVRITFDDGAGNKVDGASDSLADLKPDETWKFQAQSYKPAARRYHIESILADGVELSVTNLVHAALAQIKAEAAQAKANAKKEDDRLYAQRVQYNLALAQTQADDKQAGVVRLYQLHSRGATNGDGFSQLRLGQFYLNGQGVATNVSLAKYWFQCASTNDQPEAAKFLSDLNKLQ